jgi:hypothetical protein
MKRFLFALMCALAIAAAQGRILHQDAGKATAPAEAVPSPAAATTTGNTTFASSIAAAKIPENVTFMTGLLDALGEWRPMYAASPAYCCPCMCSQ